MESLEVTAKTVSEAIAKALSLLGKERHEVEISVLSEGRSGILGIGGEDARILVAVIEEPPPAARPDPEAIAEVAQEIVEDLLDAMGIVAQVKAKPAPPEAQQDGFGAFVDVLGDDLGMLIGRRGDTLGSLQFVTNLILGKRLKKWTKVQVDVQGYRVRREAALRSLAQRLAARAAETGHPIALEAMPPNERRIVHLSLSQHPAVTTASTGEGDQRRVVISPKR